MGDNEQYFEANRRHWDALSDVNWSSAFYDVEGFKNRRNYLHDLEIGEVGPVSGKKVLHIQCHNGMDSISWAILGATVTGVDFSPRAIGFARQLNKELGTDVRFIEANVYDLPALLHERFDIVYASYGVFWWLPDLEGWAKVAAGLVKDGGLLYLADDHPVAQSMIEKAGKLELRYPYTVVAKRLRSMVTQPYADQTKDLEGEHYGWVHTLGGIVTAVASTGLAIEFVREHPVCAWQKFPSMTKGTDGWWRMPEPLTDVPLTFSLRARKARDWDRA